MILALSKILSSASSRVFSQRWESLALEKADGAHLMPLSRKDKYSEEGSIRPLNSQEPITEDLFEGQVFRPLRCMGLKSFVVVKSLKRTRNLTSALFLEGEGKMIFWFTFGIC